MELKWTSKAMSDLARLYEFLTLVNKQAAAHTIRQLIAASARLVAQPSIGEKLDEFDPREVRKIVIGHYEMRYEVQANMLYILRIWHTREDR
jgi:plasmid stabilization system protein ParE